MAEVTLDRIKELRERSGAGVMDCKRALESAGGDIDKAMKVLEELGVAAAAKKAGRVAGQGLIESYIHAGRIGAIVEVNCETDFVARTPDFQNLAHELAMQVVAASPLVVSEDQLPEGVDEPIEKTVLLEQPYIREPSKSIRQLISETVGRTGENIQVKRFMRFELGE